MQLILARPLEHLHISQQFGDDNVCIDLTSKGICVPRSAANCPPGFTSLYTSVGMEGHNGIDLEADQGQPVAASHDGFVYKLVNEERRGIGVELISRRRFSIEGVERPCRVKTRYWHLDSHCVEVGQKVKEGDVIGYAGSTGLTTGPHLHFELKPVRRKLNSSFRNLLQDNGYFGAVNPEAYFVDI